MGTDNGAVENRQALASFPADQRPNPVRFALLAPAGGGICSNSFIHSLHKNQGPQYYRPYKKIPGRRPGKGDGIDLATGC